MSRRTKKENERHTNDFRKALSEGQKETDIEKEGDKDRKRVKERVKGHGHVCPNGQGLQSRSVT